MSISKSGAGRYSARVLALLLIISGLHCGSPKRDIVLQHADMRDFQQFRWEQDSTVLVMAGSGDFFTKPLQIDKGKYSITFRAEGNIAKNELPHFIVRLGDELIKELRVKEKVNSYTFNFEVLETVTAPLKFTFDNDFYDSTGDRNVFLYYPITVKPYSLF